MKGIIQLAYSLALISFASVQASEQKELAGHYYLQGAMEMGSELLLRDNGRFEAGMVYGGAEGYAKGDWTLEGQNLTLHRDPATTVSMDDIGQLFDGMILLVRPGCLALQENGGCYVKSVKKGLAQ